MSHESNIMLSPNSVLEALTTEIQEYRSRHWSVFYSTIVSQGIAITGFLKLTTPQPSIILKLLLIFVVILLGVAGYRSSHGYTIRINHLRKNRTALLKQFDESYLEKGITTFTTPDSSYRPSLMFRVTIISFTAIGILFIWFGGNTTTT